MVQTVRHFPLSLKITFSHDEFILFFLSLIKVEHPSTKLQVLSHSARLEKGYEQHREEGGKERDAHISSTLTSWGF